MYYIFITMPIARAPVHFIKVESSGEIRKTLRTFQSSALFIYNESTDEIDILSNYYDLIECSYFIYSLLGTYKLIKDLKVSYHI